MSATWQSYSFLFGPTVALAVLGAVRGRGVRVVGAAWVLLPLLLLLLAELVRPVYLPRYLIAGLVGLAVLAAAGALAAPRRAGPDRPRSSPPDRMDRPAG